MHWTIQGTLWLAPAILELAIAVTMFRRRLWREYPLFWSYLLAEVIRTAVLFGIGTNDGHYSRYFYTYWITECFVCLLGFFVVAEVFRGAFARRLGLWKWGSALFLFALLGLIVLALLAASAAPGNDSSKLVAAILVLKRAESLVRLGLVVALFLFVLILGLPWSNHKVGIAAGFAIYGIVELAVLVFRSQHGRAANRAWAWSIPAVSFCQKLVWAAYFMRGRNQEPSGGSHPPSTPAERAIDLDRMNEAVGVLLER